jgi:hypothetical protein
LSTSQGFRAIEARNSNDRIGPCDLRANARGNEAQEQTWQGDTGKRELVSGVHGSEGFGTAGGVRISPSAGIFTLSSPATQFLQLAWVRRYRPWDDAVAAGAIKALE